MQQEKIKLALVDDHKLFRKGMIGLINDFSNCQILYEADHGEELTRKIVPKNCPNIVILDISMPVMSGYETAVWLKKHYPQVKTLVLTMNDSEESIIKMLKAGVNGYILKDAEPSELELALNEIMKKGIYYSDLVSGALLNNITKEAEVKVQDKVLIKLNDRELEFLKLACTELTYKEIADKMVVSVRTVDGYREVLFEKLQVKNRIGLALYAIKHKLVKIY